ncbi:Short-chain fatty acids transporter [Kordia antarctica]|uniref:Short-chain fatty acids transporter n=1 Tax=Kordia antarctica TaxID=1218801 RepID=A0A7L4ZKC4_9FLAO|nr:TIGR00366 family protein [Kordia antarctica]QHI37153.1 Short-chain fatty acids transporter [Kordia antarctica]
MQITKAIETIFKRYLPSPFTIAVLLTLITIALATFFTKPVTETTASHFIEVLSFWEDGIWNSGLLVFAYQMMLILVLGHVLVLSKPVNSIILAITKSVTNTTNAVILVSVTTMLVAFFNWGLGLIFGAILARKVGEHAQKHQIPINYPLVGAAGYVGLMVWHGGISGSAPSKVAEEGHLLDMMNGILSVDIFGKVPEVITSSSTIFSWWNLLLFGILLVVIPFTLSILSKRAKPTKLNLPKYKFDTKNKEDLEGAEKLDYSPWFASVFGILLLVTFFIQYSGNLSSLSEIKITPNMLNFFMLGLAIILHGNFKSFLNAVEEAIKGTSGILIQFPLYFGIMGIMKSSGMVGMISDSFVSVATETTLPVFTFFSSGLVNIFVPSGGGQWAVQGPIVIESALKLGVPLPKAIMALAYGDQITNMLQPFWALPLLAITKLKAKEILPYTIILMLVGSAVYILGLLLL